MFFQDLFIAPALWTIELDDDRRALFLAHLVDPVLETVQLQQATVTEEAGGVHGVEHVIRGEVIKGMAHKRLRPAPRRGQATPRHHALRGNRDQLVATAGAGQAVATINLEQGAVVGAHDELVVTVHELVRHEVQLDAQVRAPVDEGTYQPIVFHHDHGLAVFLEFRALSSGMSVRLQTCSM